LAGSDEASAPDGKLHPEASPANHRGLALRMASEEGDGTVFETLLAHAARTEDSVLRGELLSAAAQTRVLAQRERARNLALTDGVRRNEIALLLADERRQRAGAVSDPAVLEAARGWLDGHFEAVTARVAPAGAGFIAVAAQGLCGDAEANGLTARYAQRVLNLEGGPHALAQASEQVRLCGSLRTQHAAEAWAVPN
jgi:alanyl aminopeptidase